MNFHFSLVIKRSSEVLFSLIRNVSYVLDENFNSFSVCQPTVIICTLCCSLDLEKLKENQRKTKRELQGYLQETRRSWEELRTENTVQANVGEVKGGKGRRRDQKEYLFLEEEVTLTTLCVTSLFPTAIIP